MIREIKIFFLTDIKMINLKSILLLLALLAAACLTWPQDLLAYTAKRAKHFQIGDQILADIIELGGPGFLNADALKDKTTLVVFAAAEQKFSKQALQDVQKLVDELQLENLATIAIISSSRGQAEVQDLIKQYNLTYQILYDEKDIATQLRILVYPTTLIIDRNGRLLYHYPLYKANYSDTISAQLKRFTDDKADSYIKAEIAKRQLQEGIEKAREQIERANIKAAMTTLDNLIQKGHDTFDIHLLQGYCFINLNEPEKAISHFKKAEKLQPDSNSVALGMGIAYSRAGKVKKAVSILTNFDNNTHDAILAYRELSQIFEGKNEIDKSIYYIKKELDNLIYHIKD